MLQPTFAAVDPERNTRRLCRLCILVCRQSCAAAFCYSPCYAFSDPPRAALARENWKRAGVTNLITLVEGDAHSLVGKLKEPIDLLFLDADKDGYLDYFTKLLPLVRPGGLVVAHNRNASQADPRYVQAITTNPDLDTVFINKGEMGVGLTLKKR